MSTGYFTLPGGMRISPRTKARICMPSTNDFSSLKYREFIGPSTATGIRAFAVTDPVPNGFYWWVTALAAYNNDGNARVASLHAVPSQFDPNDPSFFQGAAQLGPTKGSVRLDKGQLNSPTTINFTQVDSANVPLALPSNWRLMAWEENSGAPAAGVHTFGIRLAFYEVGNGQAAPGM